MVLISPLENVYSLLTSFVTSEIHSEGLLCDVQSFLTSANTKDKIFAPLVWFERGEARPVREMYDNEHLELSIPVNLVCCVDLGGDVLQAERESLNLLNRCLSSIYLNILSEYPEREYVEITDISVDSLDSEGTFQIVNKTRLMPASRASLTFHVKVNIMQYFVIEDEELRPVHIRESDRFITEIIFDRVVEETDEAPVEPEETGETSGGEETGVVEEPTNTTTLAEN